MPPLPGAGRLGAGRPGLWISVYCWVGAGRERAGLLGWSSDTIRGPVALPKSHDDDHMTTITWQPSHDADHMTSITWRRSYDNDHITAIIWRRSHDQHQGWCQSRNNLGSHIRTCVFGEAPGYCNGQSFARRFEGCNIWATRHKLDSANAGRLPLLLLDSKLQTATRGIKVGSSTRLPGETTARGRQLVTYSLANTIGRSLLICAL